MGKPEHLAKCDMNKMMLNKIVLMDGKVNRFLEFFARTVNVDYF